jgi:hypothetical protein
MKRGFLSFRGKQKSSLLIKMLNAPRERANIKCALKISAKQADFLGESCATTLADLYYQVASRTISRSNFPTKPDEENLWLKI